MHNGTALPTSNTLNTRRFLRSYDDYSEQQAAFFAFFAPFFCHQTGRTGDRGQRPSKKRVVSNILSLDFGIPHQREKAQACWPCLFHLTLMHCSVVGNIVRMCLLFCHQFQHAQHLTSLRRSWWCLKCNLKLRNKAMKMKNMEKQMLQYMSSKCFLSQRFPNFISTGLIHSHCKNCLLFFSYFFLNRTSSQQPTQLMLTLNSITSNCILFRTICGTSCWNACCHSLPVAQALRAET